MKEKFNIIMRNEIKKKARKHQRAPWIILLAGMLILVILVNVLTKRSLVSEPQTEATIYSQKAECGDLTMIVPGTGVLENEESVPVELSSELEITKWHVSNGDSVIVGDILAEVDQVSAMSAIVAVQEKIIAIDEALEEHEDDTVSDTITAPASGRVKVIFAQEDKSVVDIMYESEALMLLSLDGLMAVTFETDEDVSVGQFVDVVLADDSIVEGKIESILDDQVVVTVSDQEVNYGDTVVVRDKDDEKLGKGELYIHSELRITGFTGIVSDVNVSEEQEVSEGKVLLELTDTDYSGEYELLLERRADLQQQIQSLFQIYTDGYLYAYEAGVVSGIVEEAETTAVLMSSGTGSSASYGIMVTASNTAGAETVPAVTPEDTPVEEQNPDVDADPVPEPEVTPTPDGSDSPGTTDTPPSSDESGEVDLVPGETGISGSTIEKVGIVSAVNGDTAMITLLTGSSAGAATSFYQLNLSSSIGLYVYSGGTYTASDLRSIQSGDVIVLVFGSADDTSPVLCIGLNGKANSEAQMPNVDSGEVATPDMSSPIGTVGTVQGTEVLQDSLEEMIEETYSVETTVWLSVTPQDTMTIDITVDELDILSLKEGQTAQVTLDAFPGQSFEGAVTAVHLTGTNDGGSSKYSASVSIDKQQDMLAGMNASVKVMIDTASGVLLVLADALVETEEGTFVYTSYDKKTDTLGGMIQVVTGISDGEYVEVLSGLEDGGEYWYRCLDVVNYSTMQTGGGFSFGSMMGNKRGR